MNFLEFIKSNLDTCSREMNKFELHHVLFTSLIPFLSQKQKKKGRV